jgi:nucleotide-binding universal stress UspA family protein
LRHIKVVAEALQHTVAEAQNREFGMFKHVLLPTDGSDFANAALKRGAEFAKSINAKISIVYVTPPWDVAAPAEVVMSFPAEEVRQNMEKAAAETLAAAKATVASFADGEVKTVHIADKHPAEGVLAAAEENGCDIVVLGSHGRRGLSKLLLGSTAQEILTRAHLPVLVLRD